MEWIIQNETMNEWMSTDDLMSFEFKYMYTQLMSSEQNESIHKSSKMLNQYQQSHTIY